MSATTFITETEPLVLHFQPILEKLSDEEFYKFCRVNDVLSIERSREGDLIVMPLLGGIDGNRSFRLTGNFGIWSEADGTGRGFASSTCFTLPNGAVRSPDLSWIKNERWRALTDKQREMFPPLCPDFVVELRSRTDSLKRLQAKMQEYFDNGAQLGWLIDPIKRRVHVYRPNAAVEVLDNPQTVSGEPLLSGFTLDVQSLWE